MRKVFLFVLLFGLIVLAVGVLSVSAYDSVPYGVIGMTSGSKPHDGWVFCNGTNAGLYPGCPNLTGRFVLGYQSGTYALNATGGATTATLGTTNMPSHSHNLPGNIVTAVTTTSGTYTLSAGATSLVTSCVVTTDSNTRAQGSGTAFSIMPPYYVLAYEMKVGNYSIITSNNNDGYLTWNDVTYSVAHDSATGTITNNTLLGIGQWFFGFPAQVVIDRSALFFDTSSIPVNAFINSATMKLTLQADSSSQEFNVVVQNGQPTYPHKPLVTGDYLYTQYSGNGGAINTTAMPSLNNPFYISLNTSGLSWINKGGWTKLMLRSSRDIASSVPVTNQNIYVYSADSATASYRPTLSISYTIQNTSLTIYKNVVNATGTNQSNYSPVSGWKVWVNYTGTTTPFTYHNNTVNVSSLKQLRLLSSGYHLWDNSSSGILSYSNIINATGTLQKAWYSALGKFKVWANYTGNTTPIHTSDTKNNVTGTLSYTLNGTGYWVTSSHESTLNQLMNLVNAVGTHQKAWTGTTWNDWANVTGNVSSSGGLNLLVHNPNPGNGTHETNYLKSNGSGLTTSLDVVFKNFTSVSNMADRKYQFYDEDDGVDDTFILDEGVIVPTAYFQTFLQNYSEPFILKNISLRLARDGSPGDCYFAVMETNSTGYPTFVNITNITVIDGNSLPVMGITPPSDISFVNISLSPVVLYPGVEYAIYVRCPGGSAGNCLFVMRNNTGTYADGYAYDYNGISGYYKFTGIDMAFRVNGYITLDENAVNISFLSNSSGSWVEYAHTKAFSNSTVTVDALNFSGVDTYYWNATCESNHHTWFNTSVYSFTTVNPVNTLNFIEHLVNATGGHQQYWNGSAWTIWNNYTGLNGLSLFENIVNASGSHDSFWNGTHWLVWANYTGNASVCGNTSLLIHRNLVNASGTNVSLYNSSTGWVIWLNITGNTTPITLHEDLYETIGTHEYALNNSGYHVWANYTGWSSALNIIENFINATGYHDYNYDTIIGWTVYANVTGNTTALHLLENIVNASGVHDYALNATGYWVWANYTGNNSFIVIENLVNATGGHQQYWNGSAWTIWNNYTGNTTPITLHQNPVHASGTHVYGLNTSGYQVFANYTGDTPSITTYENIVNASGTHQYLWSPSLWKFFVWANYSGNGSAPTPIHLFQNFLNSTGTHEYVLNASGYQVWANVTGNNSAFINITKLIPVGSTDAVYKLPLLVGMTVAFPGLLLVKRRRKRMQ